MAAYLIVRAQIHDAGQYAEYAKATPPVIEKFGGRFIARGGEVVTLEGEKETGRVVVIEFPSVETATAFYRSQEYAQVKILREAAANAQFIIVPGFDHDSLRG